MSAVLLWENMVAILLCGCVVPKSVVLFGYICYFLSLCLAMCPAIAIASLAAISNCHSFSSKGIKYSK